LELVWFVIQVALVVVLSSTLFEAIHIWLEIRSHRLLFVVITLVTLLAVNILNLILGGIPL
jgi:hypothetical protein